MVSSMNRESSSFRSDVTTSPVSTLAFDWVYTALAFLVTAGIYLDGWSHGSFGPDQSVLSEYHLLFYSSLMAVGLWLFGTAFMNRQDGFVGLKALPAGYKLSALGLIIFGVTGFFDLGGHALFGFEVDIEALYSPSHIGLFIGWALISIGPARAALYRQRQNQGAPLSFLQFLPALLSWVFFFNILAFVSMEFFATAEMWMLTENRLNNDYLGQVLGIMGIIIQSAMMVGVLSWLVLNFRVPVGSFTLFFVLFGLFGSIDNLSLDFVPVALVAGIISDVLYKVLKPSFERQLSFHAFNVLMVLTFWSAFYAFVFITNYGEGIWYTPYIWTGSIVQGMVVALLLSLFATSAPKAPKAVEANA